MTPPRGRPESTPCFKLYMSARARIHQLTRTGSSCCSIPQGEQFWGKGEVGEGGKSEWGACGKNRGREGSDGYIPWNRRDL